MKRPIGVFDSGVGGLTVLTALTKHFPREDFIYLADTARLPYGNKSLHTIHNYVRQNVKYLSRFDVKAIVVACNSASTAIIEHPFACEVPLLNVVAPGSRKALEVTQTKRIGVLGTRATVASNAYKHAIQKLDPNCYVAQQPCPLLAPIVEEGWFEDPITNLIVYRYVSAILKAQIDTLILGCTHYPALRGAIRRAAGNAIEFVDSSQGLIEDLEILGLAKEGGREGSLRILCTDFSPRLEETIKLLLGDIDYEHLETVDL